MLAILKTNLSKYLILLVQLHILINIKPALSETLMPGTTPLPFHDSLVQILVTCLL